MGWRVAEPFKVVQLSAAPSPSFTAGGTLGECVHSHRGGGGYSHKGVWILPLWAVNTPTGECGYSPRGISPNSARRGVAIDGISDVCLTMKKLFTQHL